MEQKKAGTRPAKKERQVTSIYPSAFILLGNIEWLTRRHNHTDKELIRAMGCSQSTLTNRRREPWKFTMQEIEGLAELWGLNAAQLLTEPILPVEPLLKEKEN